MTIKRIDNDEIFNLHEYSINPSTNEIYLHRFIHNESEGEGDCGVDYRMAVAFIKNLNYLEKRSDKPIIVHMQSTGGDWNDGMAIYDAIHTCSVPVIIIAYAHARSMTSIILQAADIRIMMPNCFFLMHEGWLAFNDDRVKSIQTAMEKENSDIKTMMDIYYESCQSAPCFKKMSKDAVLGFINRKLEKKTDWILNANEAVEYGFADGIYGEGKYKSINDILNS